MLLEKYAEDLVNLGIDEIIFSLDGPREIHDTIRGGEGIFDRTIKGLKAVNTWKEKKKCRSTMVAYIFPDGSVRPCQSLNYVAGNGKEDSFKNIWNNQKYLRFRRVTKENRLYPVCYRCTELYRF